MASVTVNMRLCGKHHKVTVVPAERETFNVNIETDCDHIREYSKRVENITMEDITDMSCSKISGYESTMMTTPTCLVPKAVLYAAGLEIGMISPKRAKEAGENSISFE